MASLQVLKPTLSSLSLSQSNYPRKTTSNCFHQRMPKIPFFGASKYCIKLRVCCEVQDTENQNNGEEPPESLFMKELKRRGMNPTSLLEEQSKLGVDEDEDEAYLNKEDGVFQKRSSSNLERMSLENQRERSMALNSEGLEGLIPRAKLLLTLGGTFFLGFWPLILITAASFSALYFYFGPTFVHDGSNMNVSPPPYVDPYELLEDERMSKMAPRLK